MAGKRRRIKTRRATLKGRYKGDPVSIQISVRLKRVPKGVKISRALLEDMIRRKAETSSGHWDAKKKRVVGAREGKDPKGIELRITSWKNPDRQKARDRTDRDYGPQSDRWGSLWQAITRARIRLHRA
jgi:hypothetical protein